MMKSAEELKQNFLQVRLEYWRGQKQTRTVKKIIKELELIQVIVGKSNAGETTQK